ncbi:fructose-bisphosphate aldolase [Candidatus Uhrbacteria bacterium CG10_big_fil_rev_8_21_14_0_10_50_16]|uniref:Fructose-bisphosphate aldolase n=1 Tax=Candidatus Uhrbacteria bacterium CG10_big_fil_rev_8_21_14_0_10_50_16 TaxID=1975039 RepID=A0A2H0RLW7_9BACT|nr:MAG: fructose-bisphosphate aldolase [Candidatus Uhrbacteria bacterium CG10_big_fil_rev_8_21_14_0_10_50_16]
MLVSPNVILKQATKNHYAIGAFNINNLEALQGIVEAAVEENAPVIIQTSQGAIEYAGMDLLGSMVHTIANDVDVPVVFHLDHGTNVRLVKEAIASSWYTSVMIDGSSHPYKENVAITKEIVALAHAKKIWVEAELGPIPGKEDDLDVHARDAFMTDPALVKQFVKETGCDSLAISIGTAHGVTKFLGGSKLDYKRLALIRAQTSIPLVLHGASGIPANLVNVVQTYGAHLPTAKGIAPSQIRKLIAGGIGKVNIDSDLRLAFTGAVDKYMTLHPDNMDPRKYLGAGREAIKKEVMRKIRLFGTSNTCT